MNTSSKGGNEAAPTPEALREQVKRTRDELGVTVEALAAKTDVKAQAKGKAAEFEERAVELKEQAAGEAVVVTDRIREKTAHAVQSLKDKTPDPVLDKASHAAVQLHDTATRVGRLAAERTPGPVREKAGSVATMAQAKRAPLLAAGTAFVVLLLLRRSLRRR
ncbi:DUF3618 domain-containing protein [Streptomyces sp. NPDC127166]|uniref:DUF3618 domain-containing protein n=1 Tax=Streptomyces sp. NPDC127166 TaxID=3345380 RepID=UPI0036407C0C